MAHFTLAGPLFSRKWNAGLPEYGKICRAPSATGSLCAHDTGSDRRRLKGGFLEAIEKPRCGRRASHYLRRAFQEEFEYDDGAIAAVTRRPQRLPAGTVFLE